MTYLSIFEWFGLMLTVSAICWGFNVACRFNDYEQFDELEPAQQRLFPVPNPRERMVLWWVRYYLGPILGPFWSKPVYRCMICMASLQAILPTYIYMEYTVFYLPHDFWLVYPFIILGSAGINAFLTYNYNTR